tara:strand:- start:1058 stop:1621 length:564 start_codon:yes stop_codon:yes gene_type:complete
MANFKMGSQTVFTQTDDNTPVFNTSVKYTAGEIVQVQYSGEMTTTYDFNTAAYIHATQLDVSITPKFSNSLIWIQGWAKTVMNNVSDNLGQDYQVRRNVSSDSSLNATIAAASWQNYLNRDDYTADFYPPWNISRFDSPNTTLTVTYQVWGRIYGGSADNWIIGDTNHNANADYGSRGNMVAIEIKQ